VIILDTTTNPIGRVKCVVENCRHWHKGNHCVASSITVQGPQATSVQGTDCSTFVNKTH